MECLQPNGSLVRILKDPGRGEPAGAGVLISGHYILTCAHVVESVTRSSRDPVYFDFPLLTATPPLKASVVVIFPVSEAPSPDRPEDICVLQAVSDLPKGAGPARFLPPGRNPCGRSLKMCGFPERMVEGDFGDWVRAKSIGSTGRGQIQLHHELTSGLVACGFSGAPAWDEGEEVVVGLVAATNVRDGRNSAYIIPVSMLAKAWPDLDPQRSLVQGQAVKWMCNRDEEDIVFHDVFQLNCVKYPNSPQIYIIQGRRDACHDSLVHRLVGTHVRRYVYQVLKRTVCPKIQPIPWPIDGSEEMRRRIFYEELFRSFDPDYEEDHSVSAFLALCRRLDLKKHEVVVITHEICTDKWDAPADAVFNWYLKDFWGAVQCDEDQPLFLIFLNLKHPVPEDAGWIRRFQWRLILKRKISEAVKRARKTMSCRDMVFEELKDVEKRHVYAWFVRHGIQLGEEEKRQIVADVFKGKDRVSMAHIETYLQAVLGRINRELSGFHSEMTETI